MNTDKMYMLERYDIYKADCVENKKEPVSIDIYKEHSSYPICHDHYFNKDTKKDFYTYEEAAIVLKLAVVTVRAYAGQKEYKLERMATNCLSKESVDNLVKKRLNKIKESDINKNYRIYANGAFSNNKIPVSFDEWMSGNKKLGNEIDIDLEKYVSLEKSCEILKLSPSTLKAYVHNKQIESLVPDFNNFLLKDSVVDYHKNMQEARDERKAKREKKKQEEDRIEELQSKVSDCFIGGYIQANTSFIKESTITHISPVHNQIAIYSTEQLNGLMFLSDNNGEILSFKSNAETRETIIYLLKKIDREKNNSYY